MITIKNYVKAESLEQAYELNQKKTNRIVGGMMWLKMQKFSVQTAIDLSNLGLDTIEETEEEFRIGCMVSLRDLELNKALEAYTNGAMKESLRHIVGVQFRNGATVGGSIFGRFGFSDVLTMFLALDASVELYKGGRISLAEFAEQKPNRDILVRVIIKKVPISCAYLSVRNTKTDFPVLTCAVSKMGEEYRAVIGARPCRAMIVKAKQDMFAEGVTEESASFFGDYVKSKIKTGSNLRAGSMYRSHLAKVLTKRACMMIK